MLDLKIDGYAQLVEDKATALCGDDLACGLFGGGPAGQSPCGR